jgi:hypothetical protein
VPLFELAEHDPLDAAVLHIDGNRAHVAHDASRLVGRVGLELLECSRAPIGTLLAMEDRGGLLLDRLDPLGEDARELEHHLVGDPEAAEIVERPQHVDVVGVVGGVPALVGAAQQAGLLDPTHEVGRHSRRLDQLVVVVYRALASCEERLE